MTFPFSNLRVRFLVLVLVAVLPALGLLILNASEQRSVAVRDTQKTMLGLANLAAADQSRLFQTTRQMLVVLGRLPEVRDGSVDCDPLLKGLIDDFPQYANLGVVSPTGQLICSGIPSEGEINLGDRSYIQKAMTTGQFAIGEYQEGRVTEKHSLNVALPIYDDAGTLIVVVYAAFDLVQLSQQAAQAAPSGTIVTVFDRNGLVLLRSADADQWIGQPLAETSVVETIMRERSGVAQTDDETGTATLYAYASLGDTVAPDAYLTIAIPRSIAEESANDTFNKSLTRFGFVLAIVLVAAWVGGDLLVRRDTEANKALVRRVYDAFDTGSVDQLDEVVAPNFFDHSPSQNQSQGLAGLKQAVGLFRAAFPDGEMTVNDLLAERNLVMARVTLCGTHAGDYSGVKATGHYVSAEGVETFRVKRGKIIEGWSWFGPLRIDEPGFTPVRFTEDPDEHGD
jgi:predicted ester cyclase